MPFYDKRCTICGYEAEMKLPVDHLPQGCQNPSGGCPGVMETIIRVAPGLTRAACPSRIGCGDGVAYRVKETSK